MYARPADRYIDYQMATQETGQQMNNLASRYDLPRETIRQAFAVQMNSINSTKFQFKAEPPTSRNAALKSSNDWLKALAPWPPKPGEMTAIYNTRSNPDSRSTDNTARAPGGGFTPGKDTP